MEPQPFQHLAPPRVLFQRLVIGNSKHAGEALEARLQGRGRLAERNSSAE